MCGITGFWLNRPLNADDRDTLSRMNEKLYHRGPDGYGVHYDDQRGLAMGHARLSIIDLETGNQPLYSHDQSQVLTVNGEFYDYKRIRSMLNLHGHRFITKSDSEIALPLYQRDGMRCLEHLRGEFAFALFDAKQETMILVRDRFGIKPLFYTVNEQGLFYGSEIKSLFAHPQVMRAFDSYALTHQLIQTMVPGTSAFKDIKALKPGHYLVVQKQSDGSFKVEEHCYWDMVFPTLDERKEKDTQYTEDEWIEQVRSALSEAVRHRLEADVPVGCYLSGGIDSCSMLGLSSAMQQSPVKAFTISFAHKDYDESSIAKLMAQRVNADQEVLNLAADELYGDNFIKTLWHAERTFYNTLGVAKWCMSKRVNECGYRVVVTGEGADEMFAGYPTFKHDLMAHDPDNAQGIKDKMQFQKVFTGSILPDQAQSHPSFDRICGFTPTWMQTWMQTWPLVKPLLHQQHRQVIGDYDPIDAIAQSLDASKLQGRHVLDKGQYTWIKTMLECQILNWGGDRVDMANSMESRPAFLDHHLAELACKVPPSLRIKNGVEKWILREAMKNILPKELYERQKFAFMAPPAHTQEKKRNALDALLETYLSDDKIEESGVFDREQLRNFIHEWRADNDDASLIRKDALINHMLGVQILHDHFLT